jgi:hypothetical protein
LRLGFLVEVELYITLVVISSSPRASDRELLKSRTQAKSPMAHSRKEAGWWDPEPIWTWRRIREMHDIAVENI